MFEGNYKLSKKHGWGKFTWAEGSPCDTNEILYPWAAAAGRGIFGHADWTGHDRTGCRLRTTEKIAPLITEQNNNNQTTTKEFIKYLESNSNMELNWFFNQFVYSEKLPTLYSKSRSYKNGEKHGPFKIWYGDGKKSKETTYIKGKKEYSTKIIRKYGS